MTLPVCHAVIIEGKASGEICRSAFVPQRTDVMLDLADTLTTTGSSDQAMVVAHQPAHD